MIRSPRRIALLGVTAVLALAAVGCGSSSDASSPPSTTPASTPGTNGGSSGSRAPSSAELGRVVALGEEFLLADLLALGVTPVASTATIADVGFQALDEYDTAGITPLPSADRDIERLVGLEPDTIITTSFFVDELGEDLLTSMATLIEVPDELSAEEQITWLGERLGQTERAEELVADLEAARTEAADQLSGDDCRVSVATIYPGPRVAAWISLPNAAAEVLLDAGCTLVPGTADHDADQAGRLYLSEEQIGLLSAPTLVLLQTNTVEGEMDAVATMEANPLWAGLPAVASGDVVELDRLGFPGIVGQTRLVGDLTEALADPGS